MLIENCPCRYNLDNDDGFVVQYKDGKLIVPENDDDDDEDEESGDGDDEEEEEEEGAGESDSNEDGK